MPPKIRIFFTKFWQFFIFLGILKGGPQNFECAIGKPVENCTDLRQKSSRKRQELTQFIQGKERTDDFSHAFHANLTVSVQKISALMRDFDRIDFRFGISSRNYPGSASFQNKLRNFIFLRKIPGGGYGKGHKSRLSSRRCVKTLNFALETVQTRIDSDNYEFWIDQMLKMNLYKLIYRLDTVSTGKSEVGNHCRTPLQGFFDEKWSSSDYFEN